MIQTTLPNGSAANLNMLASGKRDKADLRELAATKFYATTANGTTIVKLFKTTRAGATVSLCSESVRRNELFTLVCRTNRNITKAVKEGTATVVGHPINVIHITRNSFCPRIMELTAKYPAVRKVGFIPLPNCDACQASDCIIRTAFETPLEKVTGFSLTYAKLQSLLISENKKVKALVEKLLALRSSLMENVLKQAKSVVSYLKVQGIALRILLSGFKGVHLFLDFPSVQFSSQEAAKQLMRKLTEDISERVFHESRIKVAFDPTVMGDLSRLCRIPNTPNGKASKILGRLQYAVPVTAEEFMNLTPGDYDSFCSVQHFVPLFRRESGEVLAMLTQLEQDTDFDEVTVTSVCSIRDPDRLEAYTRECTREILADKDFDELDIRPCFKRVHSNKISLRGGEGHKMRIGAVMELARQKLSIPSIIRWFNFCDDYDPTVTEKAIVDLISRGYTDRQFDEYGSEYRKRMRCETIQPCGFCLKNECHIYQKKFGRR